MADSSKVIPAEISVEMQNSFLDYAMSVIVSRALPDVRDGLKPVHRRILYMMADMGIRSSGKFVKSARVVGEVMGKLHPHGDMALYQTLVRLAQDFSMRYPLVTGQGNFGSIDNDPPAAMRYTEVRLDPISDEMLADINKDTVDFIDNFDATLKEPTVLPSRIPNLLLMGAEGIAVGMATKIPPHNLKEVVDAIIFSIDQGQIEASSGAEIDHLSKITPGSTKDLYQEADDPVLSQGTFTTEADIDQLTNFIKGPDFPTYGTIFNQEEIKSIYQTGRGKVIIRGKAEIEEAKNNRFQIIITQIPYQVNKAELISKLADLARDKKIEGIADLRDESDRHGIRVVVELKKDARPKSVLNNLYKKTELQTTFPVNMVALVNGTPMTLNLKTMLVEYITHRYRVVRRRSLFELREARARAHILEGLKIALDNLDEVIKTIRESSDADVAKINLINRFNLTEIQAQAILDMQLRRLAALERKKIEDEYQVVLATINRLIDILSHPQKILAIIKAESIEIKNKYGDDRRTKVIASKIEDFSEEDLIPNEEVIVTMTAAGYIKRVPRGTYRSQHRGGKGVTGMKTKQEDEITHLLSANTHDYFLVFTNKGRVFRLRVWELPEGLRQSKGQAIVNLVNIEQGETIQSILTLNGQSDDKKFLLFVTRKGTVKKTLINQFNNVRSSGLIAIKLERNDELVWVKITSGNDDVLLVSHNGKSIRFKEGDVRPTGRDTMGVRGILLKSDDFVVGMETFAPTVSKPTDKRKKVFRDILVVTENGLGKRTVFSEFPTQKRGGMGVKIAEITQKTGKVVCSSFVDETVDQIILTSKQAQIIKLPLKNIPRLGRATQGVILMRFAKNTPDQVVAVTYLKKETDISPVK